VGIFVYAVLFWFINDFRFPWVGPYDLFNVAANVMFVHGLIPAANNVIVPGGWSIGTEMLYYAIFPLLHIFLSPPEAKYRSFPLVLVLFCVIAINIFIQIYLLGTPFAIKNNSFSYYLIINQLPVFLLGMMAFEFFERGRVDRGSIFFLAGFLLFSFVSLAVWSLKQPYSFMLLPILVGLSFCFLLGLFRIGKFKLGALERLGRMSYSLYIFHFLFSWYLVPFLVRPLKKYIFPEVLLGMSFFLALALTSVIAFWAEKSVEKKWMAIGGRLIKKLQSK
jgi:peptidoglycan/LPS O-acetylase OafA/YrhL